MNVINIYGGPGVGKSVLASELFATMKKVGYNVELVGEYAKDLVLENRYNILADQLYILAKQNIRLHRLQENGVEWAVTDGPVLNGIIYAINPPQSLIDSIMESYNSYTNYNVLLKRNEYFSYHPSGRIQKTLEDARDKDRAVSNMVHQTVKTFWSYRIGWDTPRDLLHEIQKGGSNGKNT